MPSYNTIINKLSAIEKSISNLSSGKGTINLTDGTRRQIKLTNIPETPAQITGLEDPSTFKLDTNWFFEDLMFPGATVQIDLTGKIEDSADRVRVSRFSIRTPSRPLRLFASGQYSKTLLSSKTRQRTEYAGACAY